MGKLREIGHFTTRMFGLFLGKAVPVPKVEPEVMEYYQEIYCM